MSSSTPDSTQDLITVPSLGVVLRNRWPVLVVGLVVGAILGLWLSLVMPTRYQAVSTVRVGAGVVSASDVSDGSIGTMTEAQVAALRPSLQKVADKLHAPLATVAGGLSIAERTGTSLIDFTYSADTAADAEAGAAAASDLYLEEARSTSRARVGERITLLKQQLLVEKSSTIRSDISDELRALQLSVIDYGTLVSPAKGSAKRTLLQPSLYLLVGGLGGLVIGAFAALLLEAARPRVRADVAVSGLTLLGNVSAGRPRVDLRRALMPALARAGNGGLALVPVGLDDDATAGLDEASGAAEVLPLDSEQAYVRAATAGGVVLAVHTGTPVKELRDVRDRLNLVAAPVIGMIAIPDGVWSAKAPAETADDGFDELFGSDKSGRTDGERSPSQ